MIKTTIRIGCFLIVLVFVLRYWDLVFKFKYSDGISAVTNFYELEDNTVDVLILGSSHAFVNFSNGALWSEYGISSYNLGGSMQPMWNSYYYLKEALKTQTPELIVLEAYATTFEFEYSDDSRIIKNTYGMKWSLNKIDAIKESSEKERYIDFLLDYSQYHTRYSTLDKADFFDDFGSQKAEYNWYGPDWKGQYLFNISNPLEIMDVSDVDYETLLSPKSEKYYRKTIELAKENDIPIVVVVVPYALSEYEQSKYLRAEFIASEYDVEFINYNLKLDEIGIDFTSDYHDSCHMTATGASKFSEFIGGDLKEKYNITDRRGDSKYNSWGRWAEYSKQYENNEQLIKTTDKNELASKLKNRNYWVIVSIDGICDVSDANISSYIDAMGITEKNATGIWIFDGGSQVWYTGTGENDYYKSTLLHDFYLKRISNGDGTYTNSIIIDNEEYRRVEKGINVVVYDTITGIIADTFGLNKADGYNIVR